MKAIKYLIAGVKRGLGLHRPSRNLVILPDDVFLVSFPKSGNTWARFLLANLLHPEPPVTFANLDRIIPDITIATRRDFDRVPRPRIIKSHGCFDPRYPRVIYIVRDPRDVVVSQYHYQRKLRKIEDDLPIERFVVRFLAGETSEQWSGSWGQNVVTWVGTREMDPRFLLLRYEDMIADTARELRNMAEFLGRNVTAEQIARAVECSSAGRMRKMEQEGRDQNSLTRGRKDLLFVRAAQAGAWHSELPSPLIAKIESAWAPLLRHLGYQLISVDASAIHELPILARLEGRTRDEDKENSRSMA